MKARDKERLNVGEVRPSQMMYTYGIGSIVDLPNLSVIVMGLDDWPRDTPVVTEPRLLNAIHYHPELRDVEEMKALPRSEADTSRGPQFDGSDLYGAPVAIFPRWWVCPVCRQLAPLSSGVFERGKQTYPPEKIMFRHTGCQKARNPQAIPARILVACEDGHLDDFPWMDFVHRGNPCKLDTPTLKLEESGVSGEVRDLEVRCSCGERRRLADAFGKENRNRMPMCTGRRPHLRDYDDQKCEYHARPIALGASNLWFPISLTVLSIPSESDRLVQLIQENWNILRVVNSFAILTAFRLTNQINGELADYEDEAILQGIRNYEEHQSRPRGNDTPDIKLPEYEMFCEGDPARNSRDFQTRRIALTKNWSEFGIIDVLLVERLREVQAMIGFARLDAVGELTDPDQQVLVRPAPLSRRSLNWVPATELRGEGLFLRFEEQVIAEWEHLPQLREHTEAFRAAHVSWREKRGIQNPSNDFPGMRYVLLHSFSHAFMRQLALEAGYSAASLKERIYARSEQLPGGPMSGVLIYTAAPDSEGTLGGLIGIGENEQGLYHLVKESLRSMMLCAGDPLCSERHVDASGRTIHAAACHACLFAPETSCERGNRYLDRSVLVTTIASEPTGNEFFTSIKL
jgi:hypothetical protein